MSAQETRQDAIQPSAPTSGGKTGKKKRSKTLRFLRAVCFLLLSPILLFLLLTLLLYIPFVQDWAIGLACEKLSEETGMEVSVEKVRIKFPLDIDLQRLCVVKPADDTQTGDTLLAVNSCVVDLDLTGLLGLKIGVDAVDLCDASVDTQDLIATMKLRGRLHDFHLDAHDLELKESRVNITEARLQDCDLDIAMQDTVVIDTTTSEPLTWKLDFANISLRDTRIAFHTPNDTMSVKAAIKALTLDEGHFDLGSNQLKLMRLGMEADSVCYDMNHEPHMDGVDFNHLALRDVALSLPWLDFDLDAVHLKTSLDALRFKEKSGVELTQLTANVELDTLFLKVTDAKLKTPTSQLTAWADMEWAALNAQGTPSAEAKQGRMDVGLSAQFSKQDVLAFAGAYLPTDIAAKYPDKMLTAEVELGGNVKHVDVKAFRIIMPGMLDAKVSGAASNLLDENGLSADLAWDIHTQDLSLVKSLANLSAINLPPMDIKGTTQVEGNTYRADMQLQQGRGTLKLKGTLNAATEAYQADLRLNNFAVSRFVPLDSVCVVTATADVKGAGYDILSNRANLKAKLNVPNAHYGSADCGHLLVDAILKKGAGTMNFYSGGDILNGDGCVELTLKDRKVDSAAFAFDMRGLDLYTLGVTQKPFKMSMSMHMIGHTNLDDEHYAKGDVSSIQLTTRDTVFYPRDINLEALLLPDTTYAFLSAGDLLFRLNSTDGLSRLIDKGMVLADSVVQQMETKQYNQRLLTSLMPTVDLCVQSGQKNPLANTLMAMLGYSYREMDVDLHTDSVNGINGNGYIYATNTGGIVLDTISFDVHQDTTGVKLNTRVNNGRRNKVTFDARLRANINPDKIAMALLFYDADHRKGVDLGGDLLFRDGNMRLHLTPLRPILAYRHFTLNEDNFLELQKGGRLDANLDLVADDGTGLKIYATPNENAEQDLTASLNHFNVGELCSVLPYMPQITGFLHGDVHYLQTEQVTSVMADLAVQDMTYEGYPMGHIGLNAAYMPNEDGSHFVDGFLTQNDNQILSFSGSYTDKGTTDDIDAQVMLEQFPLTLANGFLDETVQLAGAMMGEVRVTGSTKQPRVDGKIGTEGLHVLSPLYSIDLRVEDDSIEVANSHLNLDQLRGYTTGTTPLLLDGVIDFKDLSRISLDINASAKNFELINAPKNRKAAAYGKVYVDLTARARGTVNDLNVTGNLGVLGNTDVTYVLLDSPITVEDEMADLVTFCDFGDTLDIEEPEIVPPSNLTMRFNINIDQAAMVHCLLSEDGSNFINLEGGGNLIMTYNGTRGLQLQGRYTILQGSMTYSLMVVSLKDCKIENGSYVEFTGDITNPRLNVSASERVNSSITENGTPRSVPFDVGLKVTQTLNNMGLEFTLDAPEDMSVQNEIAQMTAEQRGRVAVTLMATGMYLVEGAQSGGGFNTTNALNAFLQSQIANLTGKALNSIDLSFGVSNNATASGSTTTDYSFRFAKRFWGNRISVIVGGKVSSGSEATNTGQSIIDNVSIEYRLDKSATRYVTLYYDKSNESILEGQITQMGAGLVLRRKTNRLGELFLFRRKEDNPLPAKK